MRKKNDRLGLQIGDLAQQTSVNIETIRYYERRHLMPEPARTPGRRRVYDGTHVRRLTFIRRSRELGFSLADVRLLLELADKERIDCCAMKDMTTRHLADIRGKIASLRRLERALKTMSDACNPGDQVSCPIFDALSAGADTLERIALT
ncbi:MAG: MerR family transcriptional regulator [Alphaproteobacteria bacterium]|nr:MerR family transcriptional regulator [Alphaproteobacteria bacterium]